jgi:hypothetical protein
MKNERGNIAVVAIVVIILITTGVYYLTFNKNVLTSSVQSNQQMNGQDASAQLTSDQKKIISVAKKFYDVASEKDFQDKQIRYSDELNNITAPNFYGNTDYDAYRNCTSELKNYSIRNYMQPSIRLPDGFVADVNVTFSKSDDPKIYATTRLSLMKSSGNWRIDTIKCNLAK